MSRVRWGLRAWPDSSQHSTRYENTTRDGSAGISSPGSRSRHSWSRRTWLRGHCSDSAPERPICRGCRRDHLRALLYFPPHLERTPGFVAGGGSGGRRPWGRSGGRSGSRVGGSDRAFNRAAIRPVRSLPPWVGRPFPLESCHHRVPRGRCRRRNHRRAAETHRHDLQRRTAWRELSTWLGSLADTQSTTLIVGALRARPDPRSEVLGPLIQAPWCWSSRAYSVPRFWISGAHGVELVGKVPSGLPTPGVPSLSLISDHYVPIGIASVGRCC